MKVVLSERGKEMIIYQNFKFSYKKLTNMLFKLTVKNSPVLLMYTFLVYLFTGRSLDFMISLIKSFEIKLKVFIDGIGN
jgi:hypothetical protein